MSGFGTFLGGAVGGAAGVYTAKLIGDKRKKKAGDATKPEELGGVSAAMAADSAAGKFDESVPPVQLGDEENHANGGMIGGKGNHGNHCYGKKK